MSSNKRAKEKLIKLYGAECFIDKLKLRKYDKPVHYTSKGERRRMEMLTYHHILEKSKGGKATVENGALLSAENHIWFHKQSKEAQRKMNNAFQEYKGNYDKCRVEFIDDIDTPFKIDMVEIDVTDHIKVKKFNRAKEKQKTMKLIQEYERGDIDD